MGKVVEWVKWLIRRDKTRGVVKFVWFVIENPDGILKRKFGQQQCMLDTVRSQIAEEASDWCIRVQQVDLWDQDSCMHRPRTFLVGVHPHMHRTSQQEEILEAPVQSHKTLSILDYLEPEARPEDFEGLTIRQQNNILQFKSIYKDKLQNGSASEKASQVCTVDAGRDPNLAFGKTISLDCLATLRTNHSSVWIVPSPALESTFGPNGRRVTSREKSLMLGICPNTVSAMSESAVETALGNCIAVPAVTQIVFPLIHAWMLMKFHDAGSQFFASSSDEDEQDDEDADADNGDGEEDGSEDNDGRYVVPQ